MMYLLFIAVVVIGYDVYLLNRDQKRINENFAILVRRIEQIKE